MLQNFMVQQHKRRPYHTQANGTVEAFNKILDKGLTKTCFFNRDDWEKWVPATLWAYRATIKCLQKYTPLQLVYG